MINPLFNFICRVLPALLLATAAAAEIRTETVRYSHEGVELEGFLAWDDAIKEKRPGVLVVHEWWGLNDYARTRVRQLAGQGYVAFGLDMYGGGKATTHPDEASAWMKDIQENVDAWVQRANRGLEVLKQDERVAADKIAAIGYCFGGATVMKMAYAGIDLDVVASFHGSLPVADESEQKNIKPRLLIAHGNADPFVPVEKVSAFREALSQSDADWTMMVFGGARHSFTNPNVDEYGMDALVYDEQADRQSWRMLTWLLEDTFQ
ncbi:MAG: dienelactone hydrolase family protein [Thiogranum sp.]|nr:dienelactone hydrolase family protein [Thiogranum sp.]